MVAVVADVHPLQGLFYSADSITNGRLDLGGDLRIACLIELDHPVCLLPDGGIALHLLVCGNVDPSDGMVRLAAVQLEVIQSHHHHRLLAAHVVDVVLGVHSAARPAQYSDQGIADH